MKKILVFALVLLTVLSLASCKSTFNDVVSQLYEEIPSGYIYSKAQLEELASVSGIQGKILGKADFSTIDERGVPVEIYVYEFELVSDADYWYKNKTLDYLYAVVKENVVIYGTSRLIYDIEI